MGDSPDGIVFYKYLPDYQQETFQSYIQLLTKMLEEWHQHYPNYLSEKYFFQIKEEIQAEYEMVLHDPTRSKFRIIYWTRLINKSYYYRQYFGTQSS